MATKVVMEALSPTMEEGRLVEWKKKEGDKVAAGDVLAEVETDKAVMELVARADGTMLKQLIGEGTTVPVSSLVAVLGEPGEDISGLVEATAKTAKADKTEKAAKAAGAATTATTAKAATTATTAKAAGTGRPAEVVPAADGRVKASPLARKIAAERGLDLRSVHGSGPEGRVIRRDLETLASIPSTGASMVAPSARGFTDVPLTQIRKTIARRLAQSIGPIPTFYLTAEYDMERAWDARQALKALGPEGDISFNDIIIKAVATALRQHPQCNAWWQDDHIRVWHEVHVGMAVAIEDGLITPVIRDADLKSLRQISTEAKDLAARGRERRLAPEEYTGSTFSVSNLGMFGIDDFTAVINPPEAGILAIGQIIPKPVVVDGAAVVRRRMRVTMSCDHRVIDGATGAQFLKTLRTLLENPLAMVW
ncbi:MAG: pyruvate dehydrogenase complex dihydrolipoamide acetyltransferase [Gemmatimonadales bacterium]